MNSTHPSVVDEYIPPKAVQEHLISHAIRNIPGKEVLLKKINPSTFQRNFGLKPHEYNDSGKLQFVFQN